MASFLRFFTGRNQKEIHGHNVVLLGGPAPGKTSLSDRFATGQFDGNTMATIGVSWCKQNVKLDATTVEFHVWDTAGNERYDNLSSNYCKKAAAVIVVYDITDQGSFETAKSWVDRLPKLVPANIVIALVGNKSDLAGERIVEYEEASQYAEKKELLFVETSAKTGTNVNDIFFAIYSILIIGTVHTMLDTLSVIPSRFRSNWNPSYNNSEKLLEERKKVESLKAQLLAQQKPKKED